MTADCYGMESRKCQNTNSASRDGWLKEIAEVYNGRNTLQRATSLNHSSRCQREIHRVKLTAKAGFLII